MWWVSTFGAITILTAIAAVACAFIIGWRSKADQTFRVVPLALKFLTVVSVLGVYVSETMALIGALGGVARVTVRFQPIWPALGYTVGDSVPDEIRLESGEFSLATLTTRYLIDIAKVWAVAEHVSLIALASVLGIVLWKISQGLQRGSFSGILTSKTLLRYGLATAVLGVAWQSSAQTFQIIVARMTHLKWEMAPMWPAQIWNGFDVVTWPFTDVQVWPVVVGFALIVGAVALKKSERDEAELRGLI